MSRAVHMQHNIMQSTWSSNIHNWVREQKHGMENPQITGDSIAKANLEQQWLPTT